MRIYELLDTYPSARRYGERSNGIRIQQKLCPLGLSPLSGRGGVGLLGLLEPADREPVVAVVEVHVDVTTAEEQVVRVVAGPRGST